MNGLLGSAYKCADGNAVAIVLVNMRDTDEAVSIKLNRLPRKREITMFTPFITSDLEELTVYPPVDISKSFVVSGKSVVTLVGRLEIAK